MKIAYGFLPRDIVDTIHTTWQRLPADVQRQLDHVRFTYREHARKSYASAGRDDIDIRELPVLSDASMGIIAHELAHVALKHSQLLTAGEITVQEAEQQADQLACRWGFTSEIQCRKFFIGR